MTCGEGVGEETQPTEQTSTNCFELTVFFPEGLRARCWGSWQKNSESRIDGVIPRKGWRQEFGEQEHLHTTLGVRKRKTKLKLASKKKGGPLENRHCRTVHYMPVIQDPSGSWGRQVGRH